MTTANSALQVTELDFDEIRAGLKTFLSSQTTFQDYDFDGSNMSILLDLLAYNTHYNAYYTNMAANEMFLKSAQLRNNVVERAAEFGYTSSSARGAVGEVTVRGSVASAFSMSTDMVEPTERFKLMLLLTGSLWVAECEGSRNNCSPDKSRRVPSQKPSVFNRCA